jgi:hypothetical protein
MVFNSSVPAKWTTARIKLGPSGEFHMPHRCACCCIEYGLEQSELKGLWVDQCGRHDNIDIPIWYCVACRKHIRHSQLANKLSLWLGTGTSLAAVVWAIVATDLIVGPEGMGQVALVRAFVALVPLALLSYAAFTFLSRALFRRLDSSCAARHTAARLHKANAASKAGLLQNGFEMKLSNHEYARLLDALNRGVGAKVDLV